ncbi:MAG: DUF4416 family protein [Nanoarchaeota archaeon]
MQNKLIIAVMYSNLIKYNEVKKILMDKYNKIDIESEEYDFDKFTKYYEAEMGKKILKRFLLLDYTVVKNDLIRIKNEITEIEKKCSIDNKRTINLDPGYLNDKELVLASYKKGTNYKEDLGSGVFCHKVLEFDLGKVRVFWHTFPDYREFKEFFASIIYQ